MVDVTDEVKTELVQPEGLIRAEREGKNTLILSRLEHPIKRFDRKTARYSLEHRWHPSDAADVHSVQGNDFTYWQEKEITRALRGDSLFDCFEIVG